MQKNEDFIEQTFGANGYLAKKIHGYAPRSGQIAFARAVDGAIAVGEHLLAEAGTATGKSFGYLVPSIHYIASDPDACRRVVVVTANIALTEQLIGKDLPFLKEALPWKFSYSLMKGKNNFLCLNQLYDVEANSITNASQTRMAWSEDVSSIDPVARIQEWAHRCLVGQGDGDITELDFEPPHTVWKQFSVSNDECKGTSCQYKNECFALKASDRAKSSQIVVTNYHLYFLHVKLKQQTGLDLILPPHEVVVWDEAHKAADIARTNAFGFRITEDMIRHTARKLVRSTMEEHRDAAARLSGSAGWFFNELQSYKQSGRYKRRIKVALEKEDGIADAWRELQQDMADVEASLSKRSAWLELKISQDMDYEPCGKEISEKHDCEKSIDRSRDIRAHIESVMQMHGGDENVYFLEEEFRGRTKKVFLLGQPINVGGLLKTALFDQMHSVICTSATMTTGDGFGYIAHELGCHPYSCVTVESPFDWHRQGVLVLPNGVPDPKDDTNAFKDAIPGFVLKTIQCANGRTLGLFTSVEMVNRVFDAIKDRGAGIARVHGHRLYKQGDMAKTKLIEAFKKDVSSVLLGTESFWAGVDVPGEALSAVVIDRIPFPTPDDPILDAISEQDKKWFHKYSVPIATLQLKQGVGRLIRSIHDVGAIVMIDPRMRTKNYGKLILASLPPLQVRHNIESIRVLLKTQDSMSDGEFFDEVFS